MNQEIEDYILQEKVGSGQYGNVYRAEHKTQSGYFAVKVMSIDKFKEQPKLTEFTNNQISILSNLDHPNIIKFIEVLKTNNNFFLVYEYCEGGTLTDLIRKKGAITEDEALLLFDQMRNAFITLFKTSILHRDLKPSNILFKYGVLKLADFGFCKQLLKENDMTQTMVGSPIYMAPQVLKGQSYDFRADIWSFGVILYEMLYGKCPYEQNSIPKLISLIENHYITFPTQPIVSQQTKALIRRLLTLDYRQRMDPYEFINYKLPKAGGQKTIAVSYKEAGKYMRRALIYLTETLQILTNRIEELEFLRAAFLIFKIINLIQEDTVAGSIFWQNIGVDISSQSWQEVLRRQGSISKTYGDLTRQALKRQDTGLKTKVQLQTKYVDSRFYLECMRKISDNDIQLRLLNCFLYNKHFSLVKEKRATTWNDPASDGTSFKEKQQVCINFAKYY